MRRLWASLAITTFFFLSESALSAGNGLKIQRALALTSPAEFSLLRSLRSQPDADGDFKPAWVARVRRPFEVAAVNYATVRLPDQLTTGRVWLWQLHFGFEW